MYRHLTYEAELSSKHNRVIAAFRQAGLDDVTVLPVLTTGVTRGYRNKGMYPVRDGKWGMEADFYAAKSHKLIPCTACALQPPVFSETVQAVCSFCNTHRIPAYDEATGQGVLRHTYLRSTSAGEIMVCLVIRSPSLPGGAGMVRALTDILIEHWPQIVSIRLNINPRNTNVVLGPRFVTLFGDDCLRDMLCGLEFSISAGSFYQVNRRIAVQDSRRIMQSHRAGNLWDLYCGTGTIGLSMARRLTVGDRYIPSASTVTGVEIVREAVDCARENAHLNQAAGRIQPDTARFFCADAGDPAALFAPFDHGEAPPPDVVVIDPPRKGTTPALIEELARRSISRVWYTSPVIRKPWPGTVPISGLAATVSDRYSRLICSCGRAMWRQCVL